MKKSTSVFVKEELYVRYEAYDLIWNKLVDEITNKVEMQKELTELRKEVKRLKRIERRAKRRWESQKKEIISPQDLKKISDELTRQYNSKELDTSSLVATLLALKMSNKITNNTVRTICEQIILDKKELLTAIDLFDKTLKE